MARAAVVDTDDVRALLAGGALAVEVLPEADYVREHLPGAVSMPLDTIDARSTEALDRSRTLVVYCYDHECDLSSRGAALLLRLGFEDVRDYVPSKTAWLGAGLPSEGTVPSRERAGALADTNVPTVGATADVAAATAALRDSPHDVCVVLDEAGVVLGTVRHNVAALPPGTSVLDALSPAPPSVRPSVLRRELAGSMDRNGETWVLVTTSQGELVGLLSREALRHADA